MARPLRIELPDGLFHVTSRGDRREPIYLGDADRLVWLDVFARVCQRFGWRCFAYCLMDNHYHVVIQTPEPNLSAGMRQLNGVYTQAHNRAHGRVGHVFQGRFKAILVQRDNYLLELVRYVVLNPVRAGMCALPQDHTWSSYAATVGATDCPQWLRRADVLALFSAGLTDAAHRYVEFVHAGIGQPSIWQALKSQSFLGDDDFANKLREQTRDRLQSSEVPKIQRQTSAMPLAHFLQTDTTTPRDQASRNRAIVDAHNTGCYSQKQIADALGLHYSTVSKVLTANDAASASVPGRLLEVGS